MKVNTFPTQFFCKYCQQYVYGHQTHEQLVRDKKTGIYKPTLYHLAEPGRLVPCGPIKLEQTHRMFFLTLS